MALMARIDLSVDQPFSLVPSKGIDQKYRVLIPATASQRSDSGYSFLSIHLSDDDSKSFNEFSINNLRASVGAASCNT